MQSPQQLEADLYSRRPDLWAISKALKLAPEYREGIKELLTLADRAALKAYGEALREARIEASKLPASRVAGQ